MNTPGGTILAAVVTAVVTLLVMESYQTTPWLADKLMRWSVRLRYTDNPERATVRGEELISVLEDLPTLFKLPTAGGFFLRALAYRLANSRSYARSAVKLGALKIDALLLPGLYYFNCFQFSAWSHLGNVATKPWLLLVWLYGVVVLVPLVWRDRAPLTVFAAQFVLTVAAWPILPVFTPIIGIPVALYAVSVHCCRKISLSALLSSFIPIGLEATVAFRIYSTSGDQIISFTQNAVFLAVMAIGAWGVGRVTRVSQQHVRHQTEPREGHRLAVRRDAFLLPALYFFNCFAFSALMQLRNVAAEPWLALVWLYGLGILVLLIWRDRAPLTVFAAQFVLTVAAWPILPLFTPIIGIPVALYAVSVHCCRKISLLALLSSFIPIGLEATVAARVVYDDSALEFQFPQFHPFPALQFQSFIVNAIFLALVTIWAWGAGCVTRANQQYAQHQTEPLAGQHFSSS